MLGSVGQALRAARLKKNLTVEEVSRVTKIRAARIVDLESDDYTRFPNITYARSFLLLYAKYLGLDISKYPTVEVGSTVGLGDYQYLQSDETPPPARTRQVQDGPPEKPRWLILFFVFVAMAIIGAFIGWGVMNIRRLGLAEKNGSKEAAVVATPTPAPSATPALTPTPTPVPTAPPAPSPTDAVDLEIPAPPPLTLTASPTPEPEVRRAEPLASGSSDAALLAEAAATPAPTPAKVGIPPQGELREIQLRATKKIRVRVVKDDPRTSSVYNGSLNPFMGARSFQGKYFWIKATDPSALQVTINGQPVTGPESGVEIARRPDL